MPGEDPHDIDDALLLCGAPAAAVHSVAQPLNQLENINIKKTNILLNFTLYTTNHIWLIVQLNLDRSLEIKHYSFSP